MIKSFQDGAWSPVTLGLMGDEGVKGIDGIQGNTGSTGPQGFMEGHLYQSSSIKAQTFPHFVNAAIATSTLTDGRLIMVPMYLPFNTTVTGAWVAVHAGSYTADNNNKVGLYTYDGTTFTLLAQSANTANLWTTTGGQGKQIAFSSPASATAGLLYAAFLYNSSAQTTAPGLVNMARNSFMNSAWLTANGGNGNYSGRIIHWDGITDLPATTTLTGSTRNGLNNIPYMGVY